MKGLEAIKKCKVIVQIIGKESKMVRILNVEGCVILAMKSGIIMNVVDGVLYHLGVVGLCELFVVVVYWNIESIFLLLSLGMNN